MKLNIHKAESRGSANYGWLDARYTYSFARYRNPERMGFGALLVINNDSIKPAMGFDTHPHDNMEIITIPIQGALRHKDSMGNESVIEAGEVQIMSAGTGVAHSEYNASDTEEIDLLQIWVLPEKENIEPAYGQKRFNAEDRKNKFQLIVAPEGKEGAVSINQNAWFSLVDMDEACKLEYQLYKQENGVYIFIIDGEVKLEDIVLRSRDGVEISETDSFTISSNKESKLLLMEVPQ
jgi:quercetin 2,3-dioxygenase